MNRLVSDGLEVGRGIPTLNQSALLPYDGEDVVAAPLFDHNGNVADVRYAAEHYEFRYRVINSARFASLVKWVSRDRHEGLQPSWSRVVER